MVKKSEFKDLSPLEKELLQKAPTGEEIGQMVLPEEGDLSKRVRANLLRSLLLEEIDGILIHPKGADLNGAWIDGDLSFEGCELSRPVKLHTCRFSGEVVFQDSNVPALYFPGCHVEHLNLHRLRSGGDVQLNSKFRAEAGVDLVGAQITGSFSCLGGHFENANGRALNCNAMTVGADVFLREGFQAQGKLDLVGARISGDLQITKAEINSEIDLESARVGEGFFWKDISGDVTTLDLTDASVGVLRDDLSSWDAVERTRLKGFRYDRIDSDIRVRDRIEHLVPTDEQVKTFDPQPHTQLAKVLTAHGQPTGAARVRFEREKHLRRAVYERALVDSGSASWNLYSLRFWKRESAEISYGLSFLFRWVFGYGHRPARAFILVAALWLVSVALYSYVYLTGQMAPNSAVVLTSQEWLDAVAAGCAPVNWSQQMWNGLRPVVPECTQPLHLWLANAGAAPDYETFNARLYALDLFVPLDALGQENSWAPSKDRGWWGWFGYAMRMPIQMAGWIITAVGAAVVTGLIGRKE